MFKINLRNMVLIQLAIVLVVWSVAPLGCFPSLQQTVNGLGDLFCKEGLVGEVVQSMKLFSVSIFFTIIISIVISYAAVLPKIGNVDIGLIFKPFSILVEKCRVMSPVGFQLVFQILTPDMWWLKVWVMVFAIAPWFVCSINRILEQMHRSNIEYAYTLRFSEWRTFWEVKFLGNIHNILDALGQTSAMGIMMITVAERISKCDGGIGTLLAGTERFHEMGKIFAIQLFVILPISVIWDLGLKYLRSALCPYAVMKEGEE